MEEQKILDTLSDYLAKISAIEDFKELTPAEEEFKEACSICYEILTRTNLISKIKIETPEELKDDYTINNEYVQQYPSGSCEIADYVIGKIRHEN